MHLNKVSTVCRTATPPAQKRYSMLRMQTCRTALTKRSNPSTRLMMQQTTQSTSRHLQDKSLRGTKAKTRRLVTVATGAAKQQQTLLPPSTASGATAQVILPRPPTIDWCARPTACIGVHAVFACSRVQLYSIGMLRAT
jgi:hypothetical protein